MCALLSSGLQHEGRPVHAVERLTLSCAASARRFQEAHGRPRPPLDAHPVIVGTCVSDHAGGSEGDGPVPRVTSRTGCLPR
ncbi:hypothetical protein ACF08M_22470 [Streptomyces sp. NPDC015032]|uniref:hypothetical protein n=1 Tax=Streptomyces sp. NPDC015032 TaxID=3364937 RepID=UPI0036FF1103